MPPLRHANTEKPLRILTFATHERTETMICRTRHEFYGLEIEGSKRWNRLFAAVPPNYHLVSEPPVDLDVVLSQTRTAHYTFLSQIADQLHLPLIQLEHTAVCAEWSQSLRDTLTAMRGTENVFICETSRRDWGFTEADSVVIEHGIDSDLFAPREGARKLAALSVVNEWEARDETCGFDFWKEAIQGLPYTVVGDNPGLASPAQNVEELAAFYAEHAIFVNTSLNSPIPTALLEAMASSCICISTPTCQIPDIIEHGVNGLLCASPEEMRVIIKDVLARPQAYESLGRKARETIQNRFGVERFVREWDTLLRKAVHTKNPNF